MTTSISFLETIQNQIEIHLNQLKAFKDIPVLSHQDSNLDACLNEFVQTGIGLCILILNPIPIRITPIANNIAFEDIKLRIQVIESPCTNSSKTSALSVAEHLTKALHNLHPIIPGWKGWITLDQLNPWLEIKDSQKTSRYILEINFHIHGSTIKIN